MNSCRGTKSLRRNQNSKCKLRLQNFPASRYCVNLSIREEIKCVAKIYNIRTNSKCKLDSKVSQQIDKSCASISATLYVFGRKPDPISSFLTIENHVTEYMGRHKHKSEVPMGVNSAVFQVDAFGHLVPLSVSTINCCSRSRYRVSELQKHCNNRYSGKESRNAVTYS